MPSHLIDRIASAPHPYVIAELGINHNGDIGLAREMVDAAVESGADCVKFQNFICDRYLSTAAGKAAYQKQAAVEGKSQYEIIKACEITPEQTAELKGYTESKGVDFLSTPFEVWSLRMLIKLGVPGIKVSSCNLTNYPFLEELAQSRLPVLLSTGMGDMADVTRAVAIFKQSGSPLLLFQCTSNYPSKITNANLRVMGTYRQAFDVPVGYSDHTPTSTAAIAAVALGAVTVEKHFTLSRNLPGIDQKASIEPRELKELVGLLREARAALGQSNKLRSDEENDTAAALRRSLVAARDVKAGEILTEDMVAIKRPGTGLPTDFLPKVIGRRVSRPVTRDMPFNLDDFLAA